MTTEVGPMQSGGSRPVDRGPLRYTRADRAIVELAERQHGVVSRAQLLGLGVPPGVLSRRARTPMMRLLHRGVYLVGPTLVPYGRAMAAVLACGSRAWLSHDSAGALWRGQSIEGARAVRREIVLFRDGSRTVDVTITHGDHRRNGIRVHRTGSLPADEVTTLERIPITTPARTLLDLATSLPLRDLERTLVELLANRRTTRDRILVLTERHRRHAGSARLRDLLVEGQPALTRSAAEEAFLGLVEMVRLPRPKVNTRVKGIEVDCLWPASRLIVEIDGKAYHSTKGRVVSDKRRDAVLAAAGYRIIRFAADQLTTEPNLVQVQVAQALARQP
jgi:very-short-patch-repair endonuclease